MSENHIRLALFVVIAALMVALAHIIELRFETEVFENLFENEELYEEFCYLRNDPHSYESKYICYKK